MKQDFVFHTSPRLGTKFPKDGSSPASSLGVGGEIGDGMFEEMSGMVTLKRKGKESNAPSITDQNHLRTFPDSTFRAESPVF